MNRWTTLGDLIPSHLFDRWEMNGSPQPDRVNGTFKDVLIKLLIQTRLAQDAPSVD